MVATRISVTQGDLVVTGKKSAIGYQESSTQTSNRDLLPIHIPAVHPHTSPFSPRAHHVLLQTINETIELQFEGSDWVSRPE